MVPAITLAADPPYSTFQNIPFLGVVDPSVETYVNALYLAAIGAAAVLVVLRLMWAGTQYMFSEIVTSKQQAKKDIQSALLGLLIILGAVTILNTINPRILRLDVLNNLPRAEVTTTTNAPSQTPPVSSGGAPDTMTSCAPVTNRVDSGNNGNCTVSVNGQDVAQGMVDSGCSGYTFVSNGNFSVTCPSSSSHCAVNTISQMSGYPIGCAQPTDAVTAANQCSAAGGSPVISNGLTTPPTTIISCYP